MTLFCANCGVKYAGNFCPRCGTPAHTPSGAGGDAPPPAAPSAEREFFPRPVDPTPQPAARQGAAPKRKRRWKRGTTMIIVSSAGIVHGLLLLVASLDTGYAAPFYGIMIFVFGLLLAYNLSVRRRDKDPETAPETDGEESVNRQGADGSL